MIYRLLGAPALAAALAAGSALAAGPAFWDYRDFSELELAGAAVDPDGRLVPGLAAISVLSDSSLVFWRVALGGDGEIYAGSGHDGQIWRIEASGEARKLADTPGTEVFSLFDAGDHLIAGCGPEGQVFSIDRNGEVTLLATVGGGYVWAIERGPDGKVYLATGAPAAIYRLDTELHEVATLPASNVLDLAFRDDGRILASTQGPGRVFEVDPRSGAAKLLLQLDQDEARKLVRGPDGWYVLGLAEESAGSTPAPKNPEEMPLPANLDLMITPSGEIGEVRSALYRLEPAQRVWASNRELMIAIWSETWGWLAGAKREESGPTVVFRLTPPNIAQPVAAFTGGDILDLAEQGDLVIAALAHPGGVALLRPAGAESGALSPPLDGNVDVSWGRLRWEGEGGPRFAVRAGASPTPDDTWTAWRDLPDGADLDLAGLESRYLQWRAVLPTKRARLDLVSVSGFAANKPPVITIFELQPPGAIVSGGIMSGSDNATQKFASGLKVEYSLGSQRDRRLDRARAASLHPLRTFTWQATDPNDDRLEFHVEYQSQGEDVWRPISPPTTDPILTWDTTEVPDGVYTVRLCASDRPDNPAALAAQTVRTIPEVAVDNSAPALQGLRVEAAAGGLRVRLRARDTVGPLAGAEVTLPDGARERLDPGDRICDSASEDFDATIAFPRADSGPAPRPWVVRVTVWDLAGNVSTGEAILP